MCEVSPSTGPGSPMSGWVGYEDRAGPPQHELRRSTPMNHRRGPEGALLAHDRDDDGTRDRSILGPCPVGEALGCCDASMSWPFLRAGSRLYFLRSHRTGRRCWPVHPEAADQPKAWTIARLWQRLDRPAISQRTLRRRVRESPTGGDPDRKQVLADLRQQLNQLPPVRWCWPKTRPTATCCPGAAPPASPPGSANRS